MDTGLKACFDAGRLILFSPDKVTIGQNVVALRETVRALVHKEFKDIILDFSSCTYMDSTGLVELVNSHTYCTRNGGSLTLNRLTPKLRDLLSITSLLTVFRSLDVDYSEAPSVRISAEDLSSLTKAVSLSTMDTLSLLLSLSNGRLQVLPSCQEGVYRISLSDNPKGELIIASPYIIANLTRSYLRDEIEEFEALINSSHCQELDIQRFLEHHPKFLLGQEYQELYPQVFLEREQEGPLIPDFLIRPFGKEFCDIVDLKLPNASLIVGRKNRKHFSSVIADAAAQLRTYRDYFDDPNKRQIMKQRYGITAYRPKLAVIIGRAADVDAVQYKQIQDGMQGVEVVTYDDLIRRAKRFLLL